MGRPDNVVIRHRLTVDEYHRMAETGILQPDARVELIEGEVIDMSPMGTRHAHVVAELNSRLVLAAGTLAQVRCQLPIQLDHHSEPEPDIALAKPRGRYYATGHPKPADLLLLIEVSDVSLSYDRSIKIPLYAKFGVPEAWLFELATHQIHVFRDPRDGEYRDVSTVGQANALTLVTTPQIILDLAGIF